jgi:hypothetical protein
MTGAGEFEHIFDASEQDRLKTEGVLGDALSELGVHIMSPEELDAMIAGAKTYKDQFPYSLSLDGYTDTPDPAKKLPDSVSTSVQLTQHDYSLLDEAIAVGDAFPNHSLFQSFVQGQELLVEHSGEPTVIGLVVVRLLITPPQLEEMRAHEAIHSEAIYPITEGKLWAYDFQRGIEEPLMRFESRPKLEFPPLNRAAYIETILNTFYDADSQRLVSVVELTGHDPDRMLDHLTEIPSPMATQQEVNYASMLARDVAKIAAGRGATPEEVEVVYAETLAHLFKQL